MPVALLALAVVVALVVPTSATATSKTAPNFGVPAYRHQIPAHRHPHAARPPHEAPRVDRGRDDRDPDRHRVPSGRHHFRSSGPVFVLPAPVYVVTPRYCTTPGYWSYAWVSRPYSYAAWIPGRFTEDGAWINGYYETRVYDSGYWQPYWVDAATSAC